MSNKNVVFVYGTLRKEAMPTHRLPGYMMFRVRGKHFDFPVIQPYPWSDYLPNVLGNLLEVDDEELAELDRYEGVDRKMYLRVPALAFALADVVSPAIPVQVYVGGPELVYKPIPDGLWTDKR